jgi:phosphate transport system permease protein
MSTQAPTAPGVTTSAVRERMTAAAARIARLKRIDRAAVGVITLGGIGIIVAVLGILVFIAAEAVPLFRPAHVADSGVVPVSTALTRANAAALRAAGTDEYRRYFYTVEPDGRIVFRSVANGTETRAFPVPGLETATVVSSSRSLADNFVAAGLSDGRVSLVQVRAAPQFEGSVLKDLTLDVRERAVVRVDEAGRPVRQVSYTEDEGRKYAAALVADRTVVYWWTDDESAEHRAVLEVGADVTHVRVSRHGALLVAGTDGAIRHWIVEDQPVLTDVSRLEGERITAVDWLLGNSSWVAGTESGRVTGWFRAPVNANGDLGMVRAHEFERQRSPVVGFAASIRDRSFVSLGADGSIVLRHQTSERTLARVDGGPVAAVLIAPKSDAMLALGTSGLQRYSLANPHPEVSLKALFGKVWYEGYGAPEYVWQSTGATDDFESKFSLVPLVFGTIKGTVYALLFAIPLAVLGALYTSQFVHPSIRSKIKPTVEIMAALPSVVIGFLAGLYLASLVERNLVAVLLMFVLLPVFGTAGIFAWVRLPKRISSGLRAGSEIFVIVPLLVLGVWVSLQLGPSVEAWLFASDARLWLRDVLGLTYDQRNCLVVGLAMGFAVIPIIFTISEDAFSSVPSNLTAASLALGASRWQTATRVVLPTASPGVFSAVMIGFGRAVGETMIVLMATGNTPVMDWSIFNGIRTMSANIAVEIPEAPHGGTLYRVLFLTAALLFVMTFVVNTVAELIRQRLRDRYKAV